MQYKFRSTRLEEMRERAASRREAEDSQQRSIAISKAIVYMYMTKTSVHLGLLGFKRCVREKQLVGKQNTPSKDQLVCKHCVRGSIHEEAKKLQNKGVNT